MNDLVISLALFVFGLVFGSFAGAQVWRLRARQLVTDKKSGEPYDLAEYTQLKKLTSEKLSKDRSRCLHCRYELRWYDLIPLVSWLGLKGKCRQCRHPIGVMEPLIEIGTAVFFVASFLFWPFELNSGLAITSLVLWLVAGVGLAILFAYDAKWYLLPDRVNVFVIIIGLISAVLAVLASDDTVGAIASVVGAVGVLSGLYLVLYFVSKGRWIGFGDIKLGLGLGLLLADWRLAIIALFFANLIGCLIVIPLMVMGKLKRDSQVPFGPLLIAGAIVAKLIGLGIVEFYTLSLM
ncbi:prepilin peptidase [Candidatus Saccharibacteria bacterium]|nr:prepilin peptidase [Candidatus Saccharibacteria bacterium]